MTKFHLLSDLHLEFKPLELPGGDTLLLAGDITVAEFLRERRTDADARSFKKVCKKFFFDECDKYKRVYYIAGNHEHYNGIYENTFDIMREFLRGSNVTFMQNDTVPLDDNTMLFGATLWTDFNRGDWFAVNSAKQGMSDFHIIYTRSFTKMGDPSKLQPIDVMGENSNTIVDLDKAVSAHPDKQFIVMTHHTPTFLSVHDVYKGDIMNYAYSNTMLDEWILNHPQVKVWVHGHTHTSFDYIHGGTRIICNPRGYAPRDTNPDFNINLTFEL